jgi:hypothetical protein
MWRRKVSLTFFGPVPHSLIDFQSVFINCFHVKKKCIDYHIWRALYGPRAELLRVDYGELEIIFIVIYSWLVAD